MKQKKSSIGCLFWIALILLILVIFLFSRDTIETVLENTHFLELFSKEEVEPDIERTEETVNIESSQDQEKPTAEEPAEVKQEITEVITIEQPVEDESQILPGSTGNDDITEPNIRKSRLYFVKIDDEGNISLKGIIRPVYYKDSPLTETLTNLLKGLSTSEINQGLLSLIPDGTKLKSVSVREGTAFLDFSEEFLFNSFGQEGYNAQLQQIVFTAVEFSTVQRVQILINGERKDYMGTEGGTFIGQPLTRESF